MQKILKRTFVFLLAMVLTLSCVPMPQTFASAPPGDESQETIELTPETQPETKPTPTIELEVPETTPEPTETSTAPSEETTPTDAAAEVCVGSGLNPVVLPDVVIALGFIF